MNTQLAQSESTTKKRRALFWFVAACAIASVALLFGLTVVTMEQQSVIPAAWHQPLNPQELSYANRVIAVLKRSAYFPKVAKYHIGPGAPPQKQINAWERNM